MEDNFMTPADMVYSVSDSESLFIERALSAGWKVLHKGWPDFLIEKDGRIGVVEVKGKRSEKLKSEQRIVLALLAKAGIPCYRYDPQSGFTRISAPTETIELPPMMKRKRKRLDLPYYGKSIASSRTHTPIGHHGKRIP
jgi:hypothetical protein